MDKVVGIPDPAVSEDLPHIWGLYGSGNVCVYFGKRLPITEYHWSPIKL